MPTPACELTPRSLYWLILTLGLVVLPHGLRLPVWLPLLFGGLLGWRYLVVRYAYPLPPKGLRLLLTVVTVLGVLLTYRTLFGRDAGVALLVGLLGLKLLEMRSLREALLLTFLSYFVIITNFLYSQSIPTVLYLLLVMLLSTVTLVSFNDSGQRLTTRAQLRLAAVLLVQALPLTLLLFVLFPRVPGPFWGLPNDAYGSRAKTGFSDRLELGNLSELGLSDEVAFRVEFDGPIPPPAQRYWRAMVLWDSDGKTWKTQARLPYFKPQPQNLGTAVDYRITLEPQHQPWLLALDLPSAAPLVQEKDLNPALLPDYEIYTDNKVTQRLRYQLRSYPLYHSGPLNARSEERQLRQGLRLPPGLHPRTLALAAEWQMQDPDPQALVRQALVFFNEKDFVYTLSPAPLLNDPIDEFLFDTKAGFCEHYSAAFVTLMRAAGVPARVVVGYQGGTLNPLGDYLVVRQRDAHAWAEVWLAQQGWVRVDPTAAVDPSRIEQGIDTALPNDNTALGLTLAEDSALYGALLQLRNAWDALNNRWNQWVLGYSRAQQSQLLAWLGLEQYGYRALTALLFAGSGLVLIGIAAWLFSIRRLAAQDPVQRLYLAFCAKLARRGLARRPAEGPRDFAARASRTWPAQATQLQAVIDLYITLRYRAPSPEGYAQLVRAIRRCTL